MDNSYQHLINTLSTSYPHKHVDNYSNIIILIYILTISIPLFILSVYIMDIPLPITTVTPVQRRPATPWNKADALKELSKFQIWVVAQPQNVFYYEYLHKNQYLPMGWFNYLKEKYTSDKKICAVIKNIEFEIARKKLELSQKGKLKETSVIFELKCKFGFNDHSSNSQNITLNVLNAGMSEKDINKKISGLLKRHTIATDMPDMQAVEASYREVTS